MSSLTRELADPTRPISRYLTIRFPQLRSVVREWDRATRGARTIRPQGRVDYALVGGAFGYRLGFSYRADPPYAALLGACRYTATTQVRHLGALRFDIIQRVPLEILGFVRVLADDRVQLLEADYDADLADPDGWWTVDGDDETAVELLELFESTAHLAGALTGRRPNPASSHEANLLAHCYVLAQLERAYRARVLVPELAGATVQQMLDQVPRAALGDLRQLSGVLAGGGGDQLNALGARRTVVAPLFVEHWADGDLIVGSTLIDCKTTKYPKFTREHFQQVLAYLLLDRGDLFGLDAVGIYLARQGQLVRWPVELLLAATGSRQATLRLLREEFAKVVLAQYGARLAERWRTMEPVEFHRVNELPAGA